MSLLMAILASVALDLSQEDVASLCPEGGAPAACADALEQAGVDVTDPAKVPRAALLALDAQCEAGDGRSCNMAGAARDLGFDPAQDRAEALALYARSCQLDYGHGCKNLGFLYQHGKGVEADLTKALEAYEAGCALEHVSACGMVAELHFSGAAPEPSDAVAYARYGQVCLMGSGLGCFQAGVMVKQERQPVEETPVPFETWMTRGCRASSPFAMSCVYAGLHFEGTGEARGQEIARDAYVRACDLGEPQGCGELGRALLAGVGGPQDAEMAGTIWRRACAAGHENSCAYLQESGLGLAAPEEP